MTDSELIEAARCYKSCIPEGMQIPVLIYLFNQIASGQVPAACTYQSGTGSPVGTATPAFIGQLYHDTNADTYYRSTGLTNADWTAIAGAPCVALSGAVDPTGVTTPDFIGQLYHDTVADTYYRSTGLTNADWTAIASGVCNGMIWGPNATSLDAVDFSGSPLGTDPETLDFPTLTTITNNLDLSGIASLTEATLPVLASVGGNVNILLGNPSVLDLGSLATVVGDVSIDATMATLDLSALTTAGNIYVNPTVATVNFNALTGTGDFDVSSNASLASLLINSLAATTGVFQCNTCPNLPALNAPLLVTVGGDFLAYNCGLLVSASLPVWVPTDGTTIRFDGDALNATSVELILRRCVLAGVTTCTINLSGGTNAGLASLSVQGQADAATLGAQLTINP